jgi:formylglycine-generating enzyme required for sulfatase activity
MRFLSLFLSFWLLVQAIGCSKSEETAQAPEDSADISTTIDAEPVPQQGVAPVVLSPEDQEKAKQAPDGMVFIKGGCFIMGNDFAQEDERPEHEVCLDDFYLDKYEVTQARWEKSMDSNPSRFIGADLPVEQVNYFDAQEFVENSKGECRLPTEAEWEYAARGGANSRYFWGNMMDSDYAWYEDSAEMKTHPVGENKPNQFGVYDMLGNVWEWTEDWYEPWYQARTKNNPKGPKAGDYKVIRGGGFDSSAGALRPTNRTWLHPKNRVFPKVTSYGQVMNEVYNYIGFRCAQSIGATLAAPAKTE